MLHKPEELLIEAAVVQQPETLLGGELARLVLGFDPVQAARKSGLRLPLAQLVELFAGGLHTSPPDAGEAGRRPV